MIMTNITPYCKLYKKLPSSFLDNPTIQNMIGDGDVVRKKGRYGRTEISDKLLAEFFLWLHPSTRKAIIDGYKPADIMKVLNNKMKN